MTIFENDKGTLWVSTRWEVAVYWEARDKAPEVLACTLQSTRQLWIYRILEQDKEADEALGIPVEELPRLLVQLIRLAGYEANL